MKKTNADNVLIQALPALISDNLAAAGSPEISAKKILGTLKHSSSDAGLPREYENSLHGLRYTKGDGMTVCSTPVIPYCIYSNESGDGSLGIGLMTINVTGKIVCKRLELEAFRKEAGGCQI